MRCAHVLYQLPRELTFAGCALPTSEHANGNCAEHASSAFASDSSTGWRLCAATCGSTCARARQKSRASTCVPRRACTRLCMRVRVCGGGVRVHRRLLVRVICCQRARLSIVILHVERTFLGVDGDDAAEAPRAAALPVRAHAVAADVIALDVAAAQRLRSHTSSKGSMPHDHTPNHCHKSKCRVLYCRVRACARAYES
eukprot:4762354-Pleurochrysis_carterae.AAC.1